MTIQKITGVVLNPYTFKFNINTLAVHTYINNLAHKGKWHLLTKQWQKYVS